MTVSKNILKISAGALMGLGAGLCIGYFIRDKKAKSEIEELNLKHDENLKSAQEYYEDRFHREVENRAKDLLAEAAQARQKPLQGAETVQTVSEDEEGEEGQDEAVEGPSEPSSDPPKEYKRAIPPNTLINHNAFDQPQSDPTEAVDYTRFNQSRQPQAVVGQNLLKDDRVALSSRAKEDIRDSIRNKEAEDDLREWMESHDASGYPVSTEDDRDEDEEIEIPDEQFELNVAKAQSGDLGAMIIDEEEYSNRIGFDKVFVMYCELDDTWCDEDLNKIEDPAVVYGQIVGSLVPDVKSLFAMGAQVSGEEERFYIRNTKVGTDYEVMRYHRAYYGDICDNPLLTK